MERPWLIRTKNNHLLGPVSKEKIIELIENGSLKGDDEICSANGFWIFIREKELLERYLIENKLQTFNPVSEAKDVLITPLTQATEIKKKMNKSKEPEIDLSVLKEPWLTENKIKFFMYTGFVILAALIYFRHLLIKSLKDISFNPLIPNSYAQEIVKKKTSLNL
jgi:hypothetical protein